MNFLAFLFACLALVVATVVSRAVWFGFYYSQAGVAEAEIVLIGVVGVLAYVVARSLLE